MAEKILTEAGLKKASSKGNDTMIVGLGWHTKKRILGWKETDAFTTTGKNRVDLTKVQKGEVYLSELYMKAVAADKKTTRWDIISESANVDTFYLHVLPTLLASQADMIGKNCDKQVEKVVTSDNAVLNALTAATVR